LSKVISRYHERYPKIRVKILDASANDVLSAVSSGEADFGLNFVGGEEPDVDFKPLLEERFVAACRRDHPLAGKRRVSWTELAQYDYISVSKVSGNRLLLDQALSGLRGRPQSIYETQHVTSMIGLIRRKGRTLSPAAQQLYAFFSEMKATRAKATGPRAAS